MNRVYRYGLLAPTDKADEVYRQIRAAHRYRNQLVEIERGRRVACAEPNADKDAVNARAADLRRGARALCGCYWGTYLLVESADDQARKAKAPPHFVRWEGEGAVAVQVQGGISSAELETDTRVRVLDVDARNRGRLLLRIGSEGRGPVWAEWPILLHRPIPDSATIKWVAVHMRRRGRRVVWSVEFSLALLPAEKRCGHGAVGVDIGWRMVDGDMRVCTYASNDGRDVGELCLSAHELGGFDRAQSLRSTRDQHLNDLRARLVAYRETADEAFRAATTRMHAWRSPGKFVRLLRDFPSAPGLAEWKYRDVHLWDWECGQRARSLARRRKKYEAFAASLAARYETLVLEDFDLRVFARRPAKEAPRDEAGRRETHQSERARAQRHEASTSELRGILVNAFEMRGGRVVYIPAQDTTRTCSTCGLVVDRDFATSIDWTCDCGAVHDQDVNASDNLCERYHVVGAAGSARNAKRAKGGAKRESKWQRLKREKVEKATAREAAPEPAE